MEDWKKDLEEIRKYDDKLNKRDIEAEKRINEQFPDDEDENEDIDLSGYEVVDNG